MKAVCFALLTWALLMLLPVDAEACSCWNLAPICETYWKTDVVFIGTVTKKTPEPGKEGSQWSGERFVSFAVGETFRGTHTGKAVVTTGSGGGHCGYYFELGKTYLVYAYLNKDTGELSTSSCTRTGPLTEATDDLNYIRDQMSAVAGATIYGKVSQENYEVNGSKYSAKPLSDVELRVEGESTRISTRTDEYGGYQVTGLSEGKYKLTLKVPQGLMDQSRVEASEVREDVEIAGKGCAERGFLLLSDTRVRGRVVDVADQPVAKIGLDLSAASSDRGYQQPSSSATTDEEGRFEFRTVKAGDYLLGVRILKSLGDEIQPYRRTYYPDTAYRSQAGVITVKEGEHVGDIELRLPMRLTEHSLEGVVVWSDGRAASGVSIEVSVKEEGEQSAAWWFKADDRGHFKLKVYEGMNYSVRAHPLKATGSESQSPWVEVFGSPGGEPVRLVLPIQPK